MKTIALDNFIEETEDFRFSCWQGMYVKFGNKEYPILRWTVECDPMNTKENPDNRETCNHRIILEIE